MSAEPVAPIVPEHGDPIILGTLSDEFSFIPGEPRQLLDRSGHEFWGGPVTISSLPAPEGLTEAIPLSVGTVPAASSNVTDAKSDTAPLQPAPVAVVELFEGLANGEAAIVPPPAGPADRPRLDPSQHELWGGPLIVSFITPSDEGEEAGPIVQAPASEAMQGSVDAEIARKLAMIRQDLGTFGATGAGEIDRLRQLPAQAMDIFA